MRLLLGAALLCLGLCAWRGKAFSSWDAHPAAAAGGRAARSRGDSSWCRSAASPPGVLMQTAADPDSDGAGPERETMVQFARALQAAKSVLATELQGTRVGQGMDSGGAAFGVLAELCEVSPVGDKGADCGQLLAGEWESIASPPSGTSLASIATALTGPSNAAAQVISAHLDETQLPKAWHEPLVRLESLRFRFSFDASRRPLLEYEAQADFVGAEEERGMLSLEGKCVKRSSKHLSFTREAMQVKSEGGWGELTATENLGKSDHHVLFLDQSLLVLSLGPQIDGDSVFVLSRSTS